MPPPPWSLGWRPSGDPAHSYNPDLYPLCRLTTYRLSMQHCSFGPNSDTTRNLPGDWPQNDGGHHAEPISPAIDKFKLEPIRKRAHPELNSRKTIEASRLATRTPLSGYYITAPIHSPRTASQVELPNGWKRDILIRKEKAWPVFPGPQAKHGSDLSSLHDSAGGRTELSPQPNNHLILQHRVWELVFKTQAYHARDPEFNPKISAHRVHVCFDKLVVLIDILAHCIYLDIGVSHQLAPNEISGPRVQRRQANDSYRSAHSGSPQWIANIITP